MVQVKEHHRPKTVKQAVTLLKKYGNKSKVIAGGTDVMVLLRAGNLNAERLVSITAISSLHKIKFSEKSGLNLGALVTYRDVLAHPVVREHYPMLIQAASLVAGAQVRSAGTIVGNLCHASPAADMAPPLLALGAQIEISGVDAKRLVDLVTFFKGPNTTILKRGELVTGVATPPPGAGSGSSFFKHGGEIATVSVAAYLCIDDGKVEDVRIALGAVAPVPMRAAQAENALQGKTFTDKSCRAAASAAAKECKPISDLRGSAGYRRQMVEVFTRRALEEAAKVAQAR